MALGHKLYRYTYQLMIPSGEATHGLIHPRAVFLLGGWPSPRRALRLSMPGVQRVKSAEALDREETAKPENEARRQRVRSLVVGGLMVNAGWL